MANCLPCQIKVQTRENILCCKSTSSNVLETSLKLNGNLSSLPKSCQNSNLRGHFVLQVYFWRWCWSLHLLSGFCYVLEVCFFLLIKQATLRWPLGPPFPFIFLCHLADTQPWSSLLALYKQSFPIICNCFVSLQWQNPRPFPKVNTLQKVCASPLYVIVLQLPSLSALIPVDLQTIPCIAD